MTQDTGLVKRGLVLLGVIGVLAIAFGVSMWFRGAPKARGKEQTAAEPYVALVPVPAAGFPAAVNWAALYQLHEHLPSNPGWEIRYAATQVLANRGSPNLPLDNVLEMLDEQRQRRNHPVSAKDGRMVPDEAEVQRILLIGLRAVHEWHKHPAAVQSVGKDNPKLQRIYQAVAVLAEHPNQVIKNEALKVQLALK